ncbi:hypothetical protein PHYSODRAFT_530787 [Phytophthora sojae]|uniref:HTH CENPB-type domain-containing protein n=1 Tax=Phytophthora sojae (strain P6497) TaxID=1094619 RepID=G5ABZ2_PHYSP|nr:hypothetical protein PHYSODRAFT_530787 [Phytophthora sojae]EGZ06867.1 hypothetical protein PHYSODRAFT_530787 [Phytophthora sojae]|eukprot:XP_009537631.1 hypothetical protein PHYSODRAFT_530787 [Phytophthora sojae]
MSTPRVEDPTPAPAAPVQPQSHGNPEPVATSAPAVSAESFAPSAALNGALEATQQTVLPTAQPEASAAPSEAAEASTEPVKKGKGVGKRLTDRQRVEILELIDKSGGSLSNAEIARRYGITRAAIQKLKLKGAEVRARYRYGSAETRDGRKRGGHVMSVPFERELFEWVRGLKARKVPVPPSLVKEKAKLLVPKYGLGNFQASNGWYYNFCRRFNLTTGGLVEERDALPEGDDRNQSKSDRMLALLEQQNALLERQNSMIEEQAETIKKLFVVVTKGGTAL